MKKKHSSGPTGRAMSAGLFLAVALSVVAGFAFVAPGARGDQKRPDVLTGSVVSLDKAARTMTLKTEDDKTAKVVWLENTAVDARYNLPLREVPPDRLARVSGPIEGDPPTIKAGRIIMPPRRNNLQEQIGKDGVVGRISWEGDAARVEALGKTFALDVNPRRKMVVHEAVTAETLEKGLRVSAVGKLDGGTLTANRFFVTLDGPPDEGESKRAAEPKKEEAPSAPAGAGGFRIK